LAKHNKKIVDSVPSIKVETSSTNTIVKSDNSYFKYLAIIILITAGVFSYAASCEIVNWDDEAYINLNKYIKDMSWEGIKNMFALDAFYGGNYHPLVAFTNGVEYSLFGQNAMTFHIGNVIIHLINVILVYIFIKKLSNLPAVALGVAALFAWHPMHVESVIWISERKDVLYSCFYLLAMIAYINFLDSKKAFYLVLGVIWFLLSLLSKSMAVTLPLVLILINWYKNKSFNLKSIMPILPYFALSLAFGLLALKSQEAQGYIADNGAVFTIIQKAMFVFYNIAFYVVKLFIPTHLCTLHPFPIPQEGSIPFIYYVSPLVVVGLGLLIFKHKRYKAELLFGLGFFIASIILVIQIIQVGSAVVAERYTYMSYIGLFYIIVYWLNELYDGKIASLVNFKKMVLPFSMIVLMVFAISSYLRTKVWENGITLWTDATEKYPETSHYGWYGLANALNNNKQSSEALVAYDKAIAINPAFASYYLNRSGAKSTLKDRNGAIADLDISIKLNPKQSQSLYNRGLYRTEINEWQKAINDFDAAIALDPNYLSAIFLRGLSKKNLNDFSGALQDYNRVLQIDPTYSNAYNNSANIFLLQKEYDKAIEIYNKSLSINPKDANAVTNKAVAYLQKGDKQNACIYFNQAAGMGNVEAANAVKNICK
jgi:protein O-mannosyl-transferase